MKHYQNDLNVCVTWTISDMRNAVFHLPTGGRIGVIKYPALVLEEIRVFQPSFLVGTPYLFHTLYHAYLQKLDVSL